MYISYLYIYTYIYIYIYIYIYTSRVIYVTCYIRHVLSSFIHSIGTVKLIQNVISRYFVHENGDTLQSHLVVLRRVLSDMKHETMAECFLEPINKAFNTARFLMAILKGVTACVDWRLYRVYYFYYYYYINILLLYAPLWTFQHTFTWFDS